MNANKPGGLMERLQKAIFGDKSPATPAKPAAPKRPSSFYDPLPGADSGAPASGGSFGNEVSSDVTFGNESSSGQTFGNTSFTPEPEPAAMHAPEPAAMHESLDHATMPVLPIPAKLASVVEQGGITTLAYAPRRKLGIAIVMFVVGTFITLIGLLALVTGGASNLAVPLVMIVIGSLIDMLGAHLLVSNLHVVAGGGKLKVEKTGLFGRKQFEATASSIDSIQSNLSYTVTSGNKRTHYYTVIATSSDVVGGIPVGYSVPEEEVADAVAFRVARALRLPPGLVVALGDHGLHDDDDDEFEDDEDDDEDEGKDKVR